MLDKIRRSLRELLGRVPQEDEEGSSPVDDTPAVIAWNDALRVGEEVVDRHHQHLVEVIQQVQQGTEEEMAREEMEAILRDLASYIHNHFAYEEELMARHTYPEAVRHKAEHAKFTAQVGAFFSAYYDGKTNLTTDVSRFLITWLTTHIRQEDKLLGAHVQKSTGAR